MSDEIRPESPMVRLATGLVAATLQNKAEWEHLSSTTFALDTPGGYVTISSTDGDGAQPYRLSLTTKTGDPMDDLESTWVGSRARYWNPVLQDLYVVAKNSALQIDDTVDAILAVLEPDMSQVSIPDQERSTSESFEEEPF